MNIYIYSDESGVFDKVHNDYFVFGGLMYLSKDAKLDGERTYIAAERVIRRTEGFPPEKEVKATSVSNKSKGKLYRSLNHVHKFGVVIDERKVIDSIFGDKKTKQRYLDYAFKICVKRKFEELISRNIIDPYAVENLYFFVDEHTTATNGIYELQESMEQEFKRGTYSHNYTKFFPPIFPAMKSVKVEFCNSSKKTLVRAADIVANKIYFCVNSGGIASLAGDKMCITYLPEANN